MTLMVVSTSNPNDGIANDTRHHDLLKLHNLTLSNS